MQACQIMKSGKSLILSALALWPCHVRNSAIVWFGGKPCFELRKLCYLRPSHCSERRQSPHPADWICGTEPNKRLGSLIAQEPYRLRSTLMASILRYQNSSQDALSHMIAENDLSYRISWKNVHCISRQQNGGKRTTKRECQTCSGVPIHLDLRPQTNAKRDVIPNVLGPEILFRKRIRDESRKERTINHPVVPLSTDTTAMVNRKHRTENSEKPDHWAYRM